MNKHELEELGYKIESAPDSEQTLELRKQTENWWHAILENRPKLIDWLHRLYNTEREAYKRFMDFAKKYCSSDEHHYKVFITIAEQEAEHARLITEVLKTYGEVVDPNVEYGQRYWNEAKNCIVDMETAAGVGFFAEDLSLQRMIVIINDEKTPEELRILFERLHHDEKFHVNALEKIAGKYGIEEVIDCHSKGLDALGLKIAGINIGTRKKIGKLKKIS